MSMMEYYEREQERKSKDWELRWPKQNPLLHIPSLDPCIKIEGEPCNPVYKVTQTLLAEVVDRTDTAILDAIIMEAKHQGVTDLYLIDRKFVMDALREKIAREITARGAEE